LNNQAFKTTFSKKKMKFYLKIMVLINMQTIRLNFGTKECVEFSVSSVQNSYNDENLLPIVVEEHLHDSYLVNIFGADKRQPLSSNLNLTIGNRLV
jgi:hypothetical protein